MPAEVPINDADRVTALHATGVLDGHAQKDLDAIAKRAADVFKTKFAMISLIDVDREIVAGKSGTLPRSLIDASGEMLTMARDRSICAHVVASGEALIVPDIERDPRFADNPALEIRGARFYAGAPLRTEEGHVLGTLCVIDPEPRIMKESEIELLETIAADVMEVISGGRSGDELLSRTRNEKLLLTSDLLASSGGDPE